MDTVRFGIMGAGSIAAHFAQSVKRTPGAELCAVASRTISRAEQFGAAHGIPKAYGSYEELVSDPELDVIYIATPNSCHYECAKLCIEHKKGVLCEKPFMLNALQAQEIKALAESAGVFLMEAMWSRFMPINPELYAAVDGGAIGDIRQIYIEFGFICDPDPKKRFLNADLGGGALLDIGVYTVAFLQAVAKTMPIDVKSFAKMSDTGVDEHFSAMLLYDGGLMGTINCSMMSPAAPTAVLYGSKGRIIVPSFNSASMFKICIPGQDEKTITANPPEVSFDYEVAETVRCIKEGKLKSDLMPPEESVCIALILDDIRAQWEK